MTHGTLTAYHRGCRCDACTRANREYKRDYVRRIVRAAYGAGAPPTVDAGPAREHVLFLRSRGVVARDVAEAAGVDVNTIWRLTCGRTQRLRWVTHDRIMGVCAPDVPSGNVGGHGADFSHFSATDAEHEAAVFGVKRCHDCGEEWPACTSYFVRDRYQDDGLKGRCRRCDSVRGKRRYRERQVTP